MTDAAVLLASQVVVQIATWPLAAFIVVRAVRAPREGRALLTTIAAVGIIASSALVAVLPNPERLGVVWFAAFPLILATYPDGRFVPRWFVIPVIVSVVITAADIVTGGLLSRQDLWFLFPAIQTLLIGGQVYRYRARATTRERESVRWALLGVLLTLEAYLVLALTDGLIGGVGDASVARANLAVLPALFGFSIGLLAPRLLNVDAVFRWILGASGVAFVLGLAYWVATGTATALGAPPESVGWWGAATVAALAYPTVRLAYRAASWLVYRGQVDPAAAIAQLAARLDGQDDPRALPETVLTTVSDSLFLDGAALVGEGVLSHTVGTVGGAAEDFPIVYQGEQLAVLRVAPRRGESEFTRRDRATLARLLVHAAPALHGARALADLGDAHSRLLIAREEERRRLRRDLHDDLSPSLSGLALSAAALARTAASLDSSLAGQADELHQDIQQTVLQSRDIAHGLRPPILDDLGLVAAIRDRVHGPGALAITLTAPEGRLDLPAAVDLAVLRIVQEAVANVRRHARATACTITISAGDSLLVRVEDNGIGMPARRRPGIGLTSIRERSTELGGTARFSTTAAGGGLVEVSIPLGGTSSP
ncbi:hypothetical protein BH10ACT7_BH10ACT7_01290 [soil metagenome]